jgi:hypothetical protein
VVARSFRGDLFHVTLVDGEPKVERELVMVRGCP